MKEISEGLVIGVSFSKNDTGVLTVGRQDILTGRVEIINAFAGEEAWELYQKLVTQRSKKED